MAEKNRVLFIRLPPELAEEWAKCVAHERKQRGLGLPESDFVREALIAYTHASQPAEIGVGRGESIKWGGVR